MQSGHGGTDCRMLRQWRTSAPPIDVFVARLKSLERPPILSVSFVHGFPRGDVADVGATMLAVADGRPAGGGISMPEPGE